MEKLHSLNRIEWQNLVVSKRQEGQQLSASGLHVNTTGQNTRSRAKSLKCNSYVQLEQHVCLFFFFFFGSQPE